jgi:hypothetical protein
MSCVICLSLLLTPLYSILPLCRHQQNDVERLAHEAKTRKDKLMQSEAQVREAQSLAQETKAEAERLRKELEEAYVQAATAESRLTAQPPSTNGYAMPTASAATSMAPSYHQHESKQPSYPPLQQNTGWNPSVMGGGGGGGMEIPDLSNSHVMGSGSLEIPTPSNNDHDYGNPFG